MGLYDIGIAADISPKTWERIEHNKREIIHNAWELQKNIHQDARGVRVALFGLTAAITGLAVIDYMKGRK